MGYLDKQSRVIDVVLTERGRQLFAAGTLDFTYFGLFDDEIDHDPWSPNSLTDFDREAQIEATQVLEAPFVRDVRGIVAPNEPVQHIFTAKGGFTTIPMMTVSEDGVTLSVNQKIGDGEFIRSGSNDAQIDLGVVGDTEQGNPGFIVRVFVSGSNGLELLGSRRDLAGKRVHDPFIGSLIDSETKVVK